MAECLLFLAEGFEEVEALTPVDLLRRAGIGVKTVSVTKDHMVTGSHGIGVRADKVFDDIDQQTIEKTDMLIFPGGMPGTENLRAFEPLMELLDYFVESGKYVSAICAAPTLLGQRGHLKGKKACCYPGLEEKLEGAEVFTNACISDGNIITSRGAGCAVEFSLEIIRRLHSWDEAERISSSIVHK